MLGAQRSPYLSPREWQVSLSLRHLRSDRHFSGTAEQVHREQEESFVINKQRILDVAATYALNRQCSLSLSVPYMQGSWAVPLPVRPPAGPGPRDAHNSHGLGDIILTARYWLLNCSTHKRENASLGFGIKFPTGKSDVKDLYADINGRNPAEKPVDQSIQPGDGGWGFVIDGQAFKAVGTTTLFASGIYLINPRNTNGTPSIRAGLGLAPSPTTPSTQVNSVPDQYLLRIGAAMPVKRIKGLTFTLSGRLEGVPSEDLIGDSDGFRRPGYAIFIEPGVILSRGARTWSLTIPIATQRNRVLTLADGVRSPGDATFADYFLLLSYSYRFK